MVVWKFVNRLSCHLGVVSVVGPAIGVLDVLDGVDVLQRERGWGGVSCGFFHPFISMAHC